MKKRTNLLLASILVVTLSILSISFVSAAASISFVTPSASDRLSGAYVANVTNATFDQMLNCTFYGKSAALTANTTWVILNNTAVNTTNSNVIATLPTNLLEDGTDYTLNATCYNASTDFVEGTVAITIDNGIPTTPTLSPTSGTVDDDGSIAFVGTVAGENTTACTLYFDGTNPGSASYTMTHTGDTCTYSLTNIPEGTFKWYVENSDGTNTTNSATNEVHIDTTNTNTAIITDEVDENGFAVEGDEPDLVPAIIVILVIIGIGWFIAKRK